MSSRLALGDLTLLSMSLWDSEQNLVLSILWIVRNVILAHGALAAQSEQRIHHLILLRRNNAELLKRAYAYLHY